MATKTKLPKSAAHNIAPPLTGFAVAVKDLTLDPANARTHKPEGIEAIAASLKTFGQVQPIVVNKHTHVVAAGNGRLQAAMKLGWTHIAAVLVDQSETEAVAYAIADNRTAELSSWNYDNLGQALATLQDQQAGLLDVVGFTDKEQAKILAMLDKTQGELADLGKDFTPEGDEDDPEDLVPFTVRMTRASRDKCQAWVEDLRDVDLGDETTGTRDGDVVTFALADAHAYYFKAT